MANRHRNHEMVGKPIRLAGDGARMVSDAALLAYVDGREETGFVDLLERFDADAGSLFRQCLRLERSGTLVRVGPLVFAGVDAEVGSSTDPPTEGHGDPGSAPDEDPFEWVEVD